jgi:hypothetical protein
LWRLVEELRHRLPGGPHTPSVKDLLTFAIWALGDPGNEAVLQDLSRRYRDYHVAQLKEHHGVRRR